MPRRVPLIPATLLVVLCVLPGLLWLIGSPLVDRLAQLVLLTIVLTSALNLLTGTAGLLALDTVVYYGLGAYTAAILSTRFGWSFLPDLLAAAAVAGMAGLFIGFALVRLASIFFAIGTVGLAVSFQTVVLNWEDLTRGSMGVRNIPPLRIVGISIHGWLGTYLVTASVALVALYVVHRLTHSFYGNAVRAVREDGEAAQAMGLPVHRIKTEIYAVHAALTAVAGALYAHISGFIGPDNFVLIESALVLTAVVVGGLGSLPGAILGSLLTVLAPEALRGTGQLRALIFGVILFLAILLLPRGLVSEVASLAWFRRAMVGAAWGRGARRP
jgi:branched-chain amino acid transport system permease protein